MTRIAILSGKGGTGKTSIAAAFGYLAGDKAVLCDRDVDASNLALVAGVQNIQSQEYFGGFVAFIDSDACVGCGYCPRMCPFKAITMAERKAGDIFIACSRFQSTIVYAKLTTGAENSGKLSTQVRRIADGVAEENRAEVVIIDGPPGVSCPAIAAATGTNYILFVAEPTLSGMSDLERAIEMARKLHIPAGALLNRADISEVMSAKIKELSEQADLNFFWFFTIFI